MKTLLVISCVLSMFACGSKGGSAQCGDAVAKGVDGMMANSKKRMETMNAPPEMKQKLDEAGAKLKDVIAKHCVDDKWGKDVIDCYSASTTREDLRNCRGKLPPEQGAKLQADEMAVMSSMMGGMPGRAGMMHGGMGGSGAMGGGMAPMPAGSGTAPAPMPTTGGSAAAQ
jgi:hypothetical protein